MRLTPDDDDYCGYLGMRSDPKGQYVNFSNVKELIEALDDVLDGYAPHELRESTGLPQERCDEIFALLVKWRSL